MHLAALGAFKSCKDVFTGARLLLLLPLPLPLQVSYDRIPDIEWSRPYAELEVNVQDTGRQ